MILDHSRAGEGRQSRTFGLVVANVHSCAPFGILVAVFSRGPCAVVRQCPLQTKDLATMSGHRSRYDNPIKGYTRSYHKGCRRVSPDFSWVTAGRTALTRRSRVFCCAENGGSDGG